MEDKSVFVIISGEYSDWNIHGFLESRDEAEKYCAFMNDRSNGDGYYFQEVSQIHCDVSKVKLNYRHEVVFDFISGMRNESERYTYYVGEPKPMGINYRGYGWISFEINAKSRAIAERIAQNKYSEIMTLKQYVSIKEAIKTILDRSK